MLADLTLARVRCRGARGGETGLVLVIEVSQNEAGGHDEVEHGPAPTQGAGPPGKAADHLGAPADSSWERSSRSVERPRRRSRGGERRRWGTPDEVAAGERRHGHHAGGVDALEPEGGDEDLERRAREQPTGGRASNRYSASSPLDGARRPRRVVGGAAR
jgi:hypothetical protein